MDRARLKERLDALGIDPDAYSLDGGLPVEKYCLEERQTSWAVYYSERGVRTGERTFSSDRDAQEYFVALLANDPTTRLQGTQS